MSYILHIETTQDICSVCFAQEGQLTVIRETQEANKHAQLLTAFIDSLMHEHRIKPSDIVAVALSQGPGSYTGLRIGASVAKGLCFGLDIPMIAVDTLAAMSSWFTDTYSEHIKQSDILCPMIDARRMEVYTAQYSPALDELSPVEAKIIDTSSYERELSTQKMHFFGSGADKCSQTITQSSAIFHHDFKLSSRGLVTLAWQKYQRKEFADLAYFEPLYLKEFVTTVSKKNVFS